MEGMGVTNREGANTWGRGARRGAVENRSEAGAEEDRAMGGQDGEVRVRTPRRGRERRATRDIL